MVRLRSTGTALSGISRAFACGAVLAAVLFSARDAAAQTVTLLEGGITRSVSNRPADQARLSISREDCLADDVYTFPATVSGFTPGITLEIWVSEGSVDCSQLTNRSGATQQCWNVGSFTPNNTLTPSLQVKSRDIVGKHKAGGGPNSGTIEDCTVTGGTDAALPLTIFFIVSRGTEALATTPYTGIQYDLQGPPAVSNVAAGIGEDALVLTWSQSGSTDVTGYNFYCDPPLAPITGEAPKNLPKTCEPTTGSSGGAGAAGTSGTGGAAGTTLATGGAGGAGVAGAAGNAGAGTAGTSGSAGNSGAGGETGAGGADGEGGAAGESGVGGAAGVQNAPDFGGAAGATTGTSGASGVSGTTGAAGTTTGAAGTAGSSGSAGAKATLPACATSTCQSKALVGGQVPDPRYLCGSIRGLAQSRNLIEGLANGQVTTIGVAAFDTVGNVGPLAPVVCAAPQPIDDFYRVYRDAGGRAGGGYCSATHVGRVTGLAPFGLGLMLGLARVARRRSR